MDNTTSLITLSDGRSLSYAQYGAISGQPVLYFHSTPSSRLEHLDEALLLTMGVRLICVDRPGYGGSTTKEYRKVIDWVDDIEQLTNALTLPSYSILAFSGGGPYALACAYKLPSQIDKVILCGSSAPLAIPQLYASLPEQVRMYYDAVTYDAHEAIKHFGNAVNSPEALMGIMESLLPEPDQQLFSNPWFRNMYQQSLAESIKQGLCGFVWDMRAIATDWGFDIKNIEKEIELWTGGKDQNISPVLFDYLTTTLPHCNRTALNDSGHYLLFSHTEEIVNRLISQ